MKHFSKQIVAHLLLICLLLTLFPVFALAADTETVTEVSTTKSATGTIPSEYAGISTLHQLPCQYYETTPGDSQNMSYVIMTSGGKLIVIDGGWKTGDPEYLLAYLKKLSGSDKPAVEAWFITHAHADHVGAFRTIASKYSDQLTVEGVYHRLPTDAENDAYFYNDDPESMKKKVKQVYDACALLKTRSGTTTPMISCNAAYRGLANGTFQFDDVYIEILMTCREVFWYHDNKGDVLYSGTWEENNASFSNKTYAYLVSYDFNNSSMVFRAHIGGKSVLFLGDMAAAGGICFRKLHDRYLSDGTRFNGKSDYVQISHHGCGKFPLDVYDRINPDVCLWPTFYDCFNGPAETKHSAYHTRKYLKTRRHILSYEGPQVIKFGADSLLFDFNTDTDAKNRYYNSVYGTFDFSSTTYWKKGPDMSKASISGGKLVLTTTATKTTKASGYIETTSARTTGFTTPLTFTPKSGDVVIIRYKVDSYDAKTNASVFGDGVAPTICLYGFDSGKEDVYENTSQKTIDTSGKWVVQKWNVPSDWLTYNMTTARLTIRCFLNSKMTVDYIYVGSAQSDRLCFDFTNADRGHYSNIAYGDYNYDDPAHWATMNVAQLQISDGTMKINLSSSAVATAFEPSDATTKFGYADRRNENAFVLDYTPTKAELLQVRLRLTDVTGSNPQFFFDYCADNDAAWASGMSDGNYELIKVPIDQIYMDGGAMEGEYMLLTFDLRNSKFVTKTDVHAIRFDFYGANNGTAEIDYIYIGPASGAKTYMVNFFAEDGTTQIQTATTQTGTVAYTGEAPAKAADATAHYTLDGWKDSNGNVVSLNSIAENVNLYPNFTATEHTLAVTGVKEPTCEEAGSSGTQTCTVCGYVVAESAEIPASGHNYESVVTDPDCLNGGYTTFTCTVCGAHYTDAPTDALGHSYDEGTITTAPTCTEQGVKTFACACGDSYTEMIEALGHSYTYSDNGEDHTVNCANCDDSATEAHNYIDGTCICGAVEVVEPKCEYSEKLTTSMGITVGAEMQVSYTILNARIKDYESFYVEIVKEVAGGESITTVYSLDANNLTDMFNPNTGAHVGYYAIYTGIKASQMGDGFSATLYAVAADGTIYYGPANTGSIKSFLYEKIASEASLPELKTLAVDMLNYGAAAQVYFGYDAENLVNADLTEEQKLLGTQEIPAAENTSTSTGNGGAIIPNVTLESKVVLYVNCRYEAKEDSNLVVIIKDMNGNVIDEVIPKILTAKICQAAYSNVGAKQMRQPIQIEMYDNGTLVTQTLTWSIESYVAQTRANTNSSEALLNAVNAMLTYGDSAAAYLTATGQ